MNKLLIKQKEKDIHIILTKNKLVLQKYFYVLLCTKLLIKLVKENISTTISNTNNNNKYNIFPMILTG